MESLDQVKQIITTLKDGFEKAFEKEKHEEASRHVMPPASATSMPQRPVQFAV
jgi:hypothetical protein